MVDSNLQREHLKPSEKAFAYKMKLEAMKRQGARTDLTFGQVIFVTNCDGNLGPRWNEVGESYLANAFIDQWT